MDLDMDINREDSVQLIKEQPSSPDLRKRALKKQPGVASRHGPLKALANETLEERAERLRVQDDVDKLRRIFIPPKNDNTTEDPDEPASLQDGKLLLFQLPPLTPFLIDPTASTTGTDAEPKVKTEPTTAANGTIDLNTLPDAPATIDGTVKHDPDLDAGAKSSYRNENQNQNPLLETDGLLTATEPLRLPAGVVGKLKVHKSGKVTLDWGGTDMEVKLGSEVDFLQDVVLVERGRGGKSHGDGDGGGGGDGGDEHADRDMSKDTKGRAYALGHVRHKMILIPDWAKLYD
jgi:DNA-directed RNA polymerase III subunit RPC4